jgi:hypothetical protein
MSAFKIYSSKDHDTKQLGFKSKYIYVLIVALPLGGLIVRLFNKSFDSQFGTFITVISLLALITLNILVYLLTKRLKQIGFLTFYNNQITKTLGSLTETWHFESIKKFNLSIYMRDMFFQKNKFGIRTYLLEVTFQDNKTQKLVISSISEEKSEFNLRDVLNTLTKTNHIELLYT